MYVTDGVLTAENNTVQGLEALSVTGIWSVRSPAELTGNTISGLTGTTNVSSNRLVYGIAVEDSALTATGNTITGLTNPAIGTSATVCGILTVNASITVVDNLISDLNGNGQGTTVPGVVGIGVDNNAGTHAVLLRFNKIHTLYSDHATNNGRVYGIHAKLRETANFIDGNFIHSLWRNSTGTGSVLQGIHLAAGTSTLSNNMVRLGIDGAGEPVGSALVFQGIHEAAGEHGILHNSVYIGGTVSVSTSTNHTYALFSEVTGTRDHRNNILWNDRSNAAGTAKHYAVGVNADLTDLTSDHNCLYVTGTGGVVGREGTTDRTTLSAWQSATGEDGNSMSTDPGFVHANGPADETDLHIQYDSPGAAALRGAGATGTGVMFDHDGAERHNPPDVGADQILLVLPDAYGEPASKTYTYWHNKGQVVDTEHQPRPDVRYYTDGGVPGIYLRDSSRVSFTMVRADTIIATPDTAWRVDMRLSGGKVRAVVPMAVDPTDHYRNYYLPWCGPEGATVRGFGRVVYEDIYPFIDLHFYSGSGGPKLAFVVRPGGDFENIELTFEGQDSLTVDGYGVLHVHASSMTFPLVGGLAYQVNNMGVVVPIDSVAYLNSAGSPVVDLGMGFSALYDPDLPLVIQVGWPPVVAGQNTTEGVCWSTYLGGDGRDVVQDSDVDEDGNYYVVGHTFSQVINFPIEEGQVYYQASPIAFASKFGTGYEIRWSTFYGGSFGWQEARCVRVRPGTDPQILVGGYTNANDLWSFPPSDDRYYNPSSSRGGFLAEFNATGAATWSTYIGDGQDWSVLDVDLHPNGNFAIVGTAGWFLPEEQETPDPTADHWDYQGTLAPVYPGDGFITLFNSDRRTIWSTYIPGNYGDAVETVRFGNQKIVIAGQTTSTNLPLKEDGGQDALNEEYHGHGDVFIMEFDLVGHQEWSTYFGGSLGEMIGDQGLAVQPISVNGREDIFIVGRSSSDDLPLENGPNWHDDEHKPGIQGYVLRINGDDRTIEWLSYIKGLGTIQKETHLNAVLADDLGRIFVAGTSWDPTFILEPGFGIYSATSMYGVGDGVILCFSSEQEMYWSTYFGGDEGGFYGDEIRTLALAGADRLFASGTTYSAFGPSSFFPFTDPLGDDDWFDDSFMPETDGFLAAFCIEDLLTSVPEAMQPPPSTSFIVQYAPEGWYQLVGLPLGTHRWYVLDARGRTVLDRSSMVSDAPMRFDLDGSAPGVYVVHVPGIGTQRLVHQP